MIQPEKKVPVTISRWHPKKITAGVWQWTLVTRKVPLPFAVVLYDFGWQNGQELPIPIGSPAIAANRLAQLRRRQL